jgi:hypothetical protein
MSRLDIRYVKVSDAKLWDANPKDHDIPSITQSIREHGFRDPPEYDGTLGAIVAGNGRMTALALMESSDEDVPDYVDIDTDSGEWCAPMIFGADSKSVEQAERYAIDHNLLTLGTPLITSGDVVRMFDGVSVRTMFEDRPEEELPLTISKEMLEELADKTENATGTEDVAFSFDDALAEGFAHQKQFGEKIQLVVDLTKEQADNVELKDSLLSLSQEHGFVYRIKTRR